MGVLLRATVLLEGASRMTGGLFARIGGVLTLLVATLPVACVGAAAPERQAARSAGRAPTTAESDAVDKFRTAADAYVALHRKLEGTLPALSKQAAPADIQAHERAFGKLIVAARPKARQGDLLVPEIQPVLRRISTQILAGPDGPAMLNEIRGEEPVTIAARVNERYPTDVPLSAIPFRFLDSFPRLPEELEYRFLGRDLVLLDVDARIVVDFLRDVLPR
jgi:hypothetical protein